MLNQNTTEDKKPPLEIPTLREVAIIGQIMPHYRRGIYTELDRSQHARYTFASDPQTLKYGIKKMPTGLLRRHVTLRNMHLGRFTWQRGVLHMAIFEAYDTYIFVGDVTVLSTWIAAILVRLRRRAVHFWTIGWHRPERGLKRIIRLSFYRLAHSLLVYGNYAKAIGMRMGYPSDRIHVVYNSISTLNANCDDANGLPAIESLLTSDNPVIGAVIRLIDSKNLSLLIEAASRLKEQGHPVTVVLAGAGPARIDLQAQAQKSGVDLRFLGAVYDQETIQEVYRHLKVTVVPAAAGLTIIQSMAHGIPVITNDDFYRQGPECEAIQVGVTGDMYIAENAVALAAMMHKWVSMSPQEMLGVRQACLSEITNRWTPRVHATRIERVICA